MNNDQDHSAEDRCHEDQIIAARQMLAGSIAHSLSATWATARGLSELRRELCDVEYAEGGEQVRDLDHYLSEARRNLRMAQMINDTIAA